MWRPYLIYVYNGLKVATLGLIAISAWYLAVWVTEGDFGFPFGAYEPHGLSTKFLGLFFIFLLIGIGVATPLLWGGERKESSEFSLRDQHE